MDSNDSNKFKEIITLISETYSEQFSQTKLKLWWDIFKPYQIQDFEKAVYDHISSPDCGMFSPKPANITKYLTVSKDKEIKDKAEIQWTCILGDIGRLGSNRIRVNDPIAKAALQTVGGAYNLGMTNYKELDFKRKAFIEAYIRYEEAELQSLPNNLPCIEGLRKEKQSKLLVIEEDTENGQSN